MVASALHPLTGTLEREVEERFNLTYLSTLEFSDPLILEKVKRRCARKLRWNKHARANRWACSLFESRLHLGGSPAIEIRKVNPIVGYGVFATKIISSLSFIGEYAGVIRKRHRKTDSRNDFVFGYVIGPHDTPWVIDAKEKGNFTRFINHSYEPNLTSRWIISKGIAHIILFANKRIAAGEQLTYDYGPYYWRKRSLPQSL
jgi:uncharacterized protein